MRMRMLVTGMLLVVTAAMGSTAPSGAVTRADLRQAWVPSMCGHPAGHLVDGALPEDDDPSNGGVWLSKSAVGRLSGGKSPWGVSVISCTAGGVGWPDHVVFYGPDGRPVGARDLNTILGDRAVARAVRITRQRVQVDVVGVVQPGDAACCGTKSARITFDWKGREVGMVLVKKRVFTERIAARRLASAINRDRPEEARRWASRSVVRAILSARDGNMRPLRVTRCEAEVEYIEYERRCWISSAFYIQVLMKRITWNRWRADRLVPG